MRELSTGAVERRVRHRVGRDSLLRELRERARGGECELWLVGGWIRDAALGKAARDLDLIGGRGTARLIAAMQRSWGSRGFRFRKRGVTTWRFRHLDREIDLVDASRRGLEADLRRRDFTINAVAFDLRAGVLCDRLGGLEDLHRGRLITCGPRAMQDDPLRVLRAGRFLAQLPMLRLAARARREARAQASRLRRCSAERVRDELNKLLSSPAPAAGLAALDDLRARDPLLPELDAMTRCRAGDGRPDVWTHTLATLDCSTRTARLPGREALRLPGALLTLRWALLLHDIAKPETLTWSGRRPTFHGHEVLGASRATALLTRLRQPRRLVRQVERLIRFHLRPHQLAQAGLPVRGLRRLVREAAADLPLLLLHAACDAKGSGGPAPAARWRELRRALARLDRLYRGRRTRPQPLLDGRDVMRALGIGPGPAVGRWLREVEELQLDGSLHDRAAALAYLRRAAERGRA